MSASAWPDADTQPSIHSATACPDGASAAVLLSGLAVAYQSQIANEYCQGTLHSWYPATHRDEADQGGHLERQETRAGTSTVPIVFSLSLPRVLPNWPLHQKIQGFYATGRPGASTARVERGGTPPVPCQNVPKGRWGR